MRWCELIQILQRCTCWRVGAPSTEYPFLSAKQGGVTAVLHDKSSSS